MNRQSLTVRDAIIGRRSIKLFNGQPVDRDAIVQILEDATWAPNHGMRNPWRFVMATGEGYENLLPVIRGLAIPNWEELSEDVLERQMSKFTTVGGVVFVIVPEDARQKERLEDFAAASALVQNAQLLAWDQGIGTCWKTPPFLDHPKFREYLGVQQGERIMSMLQFGYYDKEPKGRERTSVNELLTELK